MIDNVRLSEMTWQNFSERLKGNPVIMLPLGATEQHGPHLSTNVDQILPTTITEKVAKEIDGIVLPTLPYGYKSQPRSGGGEGFPGTISLDAHTLSLVIRDIVYQLGCQGVKRLVLVNGHFENSWPVIEGVDLALRMLKAERISGLSVIRLEYWDFIEQETLDRIYPQDFPGTELEHAGVMETSLMLALRPDLVDMSKAPADGPASFPHYDIQPVPSGRVPASGVLSNPAAASMEKGQWMIDDHVRLISESLRKEFCIK